MRTPPCSAVGSHDWENRFEGRVWTYSLDDVWGGIRSAYADLIGDVERRFDVRLETIGAIGVSAMMHGYLAFDADDELLVPFRTWRNTTTGRAAAELTELFGTNIPLRWSVAHLYQAVLDEEPHVPEVRFLTTLAGYVHRKLTGRRVLGVGDASGMFPIDAATGGYDDELLQRFDGLVADARARARSRGTPARGARRGPARGGADGRGRGAARPVGQAAPRASCSARPRATRAPAWSPRTRSLRGRAMSARARASSRWWSSSGPLERVHHELDLVATPAGDPVAMVHCNNGASELAAWAAMFGRFAAAAGAPVDSDSTFDALFREALDGEADAGGLLAYNHLAGEPIAGLDEGRPLFVRTPDSRLTLANFMRAQLYGVFGTLSLGMRVLEREGVALDLMFAHGGMFRTAGVAQRFLAGALGAPVAVGETASEGGAWGIAVLASYVAHAYESDLSGYLNDRVFADAEIVTADPDPAMSPASRRTWTATARASPSSAPPSRPSDPSCVTSRRLNRVDATGTATSLERTQLTKDLT